MMDSHLYVQAKLDELRERDADRRARIEAMLALEPPPRPRRVRRLVGPRLAAFGSWLERLGDSMSARPQSQE